MQSSSESSSGPGATGRAEDEKDAEEVKIAKKEEKEIDSVTDFHVEKESEKLQSALLSFAESTKAESAKYVDESPPALSDFATCTINFTVILSL